MMWYDWLLIGVAVGVLLSLIVVWLTIALAMKDL
jgi:hypothetical protein